MKNKQESIQTFKQEFEKSRIGGLSEQEQKTLRELFFKLTKEEQKKVLQEYRDLKKEPEKSFFEGLKKQLGELKKDVERQARLKGGFDELRKDFEKNEGLKQIFDLFNTYVEIRLDKSFSLVQKDQIKLALFGVIEKKLNPSGLIEITIQKYIKPLQDLIARFNSKEENEAEVKKEDFDKLSKSFDETFEKLGISGLASFVNEKIDKINKKKSTSFDGVINIIDPKNKGKITKETIKKDTEKLAKQLESGKKFGEQIKKSLKKLPMGIGETIMGFLRDIAKEYPILGFIFSLFFGADFLSEAGEKKEKSIQGLIKLKKENTEVLKNIDEKELQKLDPKKLEKFYKYLDSKEIDYTTSSFWKELLTGNTKNEKIKKIHELLKNDKGKILEKGEKLEDFIKKLNSLEEAEGKKQQENLQKKVEETQQQVESGKKDLVLVQKQKQQLEIQAKKAEEQLQKTTSVEEQQKIKEKLEQARKKAEELKKQEEDKQRKLKEAMERARKLKQEKEFIESVNNISKLPAEIFYKGKKLKLDIENNQIVLGKDRYKVSIMAKIFGKNTEKFEKIEFKNGNFILNGNEKNPITKSQVIELIDKLKSGKNFEYNGVTEKPFVGKINYKLTISKI